MTQKIDGKYNQAVVYTDNLEKSAEDQIRMLCDQQFTEDSKIRIMPDCHSGAGCTIGTTMTIKDKIVPNLVGVDIACGMYVQKIDAKEIDFEKLDAEIHRIPSGFGIHNKPVKEAEKLHLKDLNCLNGISYDRAVCSLMSLGGGNHFIEVDIDEHGSYYLVIHTGSRHLGLETANYYQDLAIRKLKAGDPEQMKTLIDQIVAEYTAAGRGKEISEAIRKLKESHESGIIPALAYVEGEDFNSYIHDMRIIEEFANQNRFCIAASIMRAMGWESQDSFTTLHNYIDTENMILRKGAVSARKGEKLIIPINMRDGSLICYGLGNPDWNYSAPHGAGRLFSRSEAVKKLTMEEFTEEMDGIFTTCVSMDTLDESPMAYKPIDEIIANIQPTVEIAERIKPVYNFKAGSERPQRRKRKG